MAPLSTPLTVRQPFEFQLHYTCPRDRQCLGEASTINLSLHLNVLRFASLIFIIAITIGVHFSGLKCVF